jgi:hypothetical protein
MATLKLRGVPKSNITGANDQEIYESINCLNRWLENNKYSGYDTFDGLSAKFVRRFTFENKYLRMALQQGVRRFPINLRPLLGIEKKPSTKGMAFLAKGFLRLYQATGNTVWRDKTHVALEWLIENHTHGYSGLCWGNHFDYQSRSIYVTKETPSVVWTSLIGHAFLDAYDTLSHEPFLQVAVSACEHILRDLGPYSDSDTVCISYFPALRLYVHNANTLGASLLARIYSYTRNEAFRELAEKALRYTATNQRQDGSWYYGQGANLHWVDNFHTAYVLDCFKYYADHTGDTQFDRTLMDGYCYWKTNFFLADGTLPIDIQCSSQAIDTLIFFHDRDADSLPLAIKVARWTIRHMQDYSGYFYYRRYSSWCVNKTPTLHWGEATMLCALAGLYRLLSIGTNDLAVRKQSV